MAVADQGLLNGNLISYANQSFESGSHSWTAGNTNSTLSLSTAQAFTGTHSLAITATAAGVISAFTPAMPVGAGKSFIVSANMRTSVAGQPLTLAFSWLDASGNSLAFDISPTVTSVAGWTPLAFADKAPSGAVKVQVYARNSSATAGGITYVDLVYAAASKIQVLVDWANPVAGASPTAGNAFTGISPWVRYDAGVNLTRGRQDNISAVQPGTASFTVDNASGWFTPDSAVSPWSPSIGRRIQINVADETGAWHTRFDGQINGFAASPSPNGQMNDTQVSCADVLAYLNRQPELSCLTVEYCKSLNPDLHYIMDEARQNNVTPVSDFSGNSGPSLRYRQYADVQYPVSQSSGYTGTVTGVAATFQSGNSPVEGATPDTNYNGTYALNTSFGGSSPLSSVYFGGTINASVSNYATTGGSAQFEGHLPFTLQAGTGKAWTMAGWVWPDVTISNIEWVNYTMTALCLGNARSGSALRVGSYTALNGGGFYSLQYDANILQRAAPALGSNAIPLTSAWQFNGPVMVAMVCNGTSITMYVSGNIYGTGATILSSPALTLPSNERFDYLSIGGILGGGLGWLGNISNVCIWQSTALSSATLLKMGTIGAQGYYNEYVGTSASDALVTSGVLPPYWTGTFDKCSMLQDYYDVSGQNVMSAMQVLSDMAHAEYYVDASGKLQLQGRDRRMGAAAPLVLPAGSYTADLQPQWTDQGLVNSEVLASATRAGGATSVATNDDSIAKFGVYANGSLKSPTTAPYKVDTGRLYARQTLNPGTTRGSILISKTQVQDAADWDVGTLGQRGMKLASVTVDVLSNLPGGVEYVAPSAIYGLEIGELIQLGEALTWWPGDPLAGVQFIEGVTESYSTTSGSVMFYTSPASQGMAWQPGSTLTGKLDQTALIGIGLGSDAGKPEDPNTPLPVSTFSAAMNAEDAVNGFVGASDMRSLSQNVQYAMSPPAAFAAIHDAARSAPSATPSTIPWDETFIDTAQGMGFYQANDYVVQLDGWYEAYFTGGFSGDNVGQVTVAIWHNQNGADRIVAPCSIGRSETTSEATSATTSALIYCYAGDALAARVVQDSGSGKFITGSGLLHFSVRYIGNGTARN